MAELRTAGGRPAEDAGLPDPLRWNHNIHHHALLLAAAPPGARRALDVGCGDGLLTRRLRERVEAVAGLDMDAVSLALARAHPGARDIGYVVGDILRPPFPPASFDLVTAVATLHHLEARAGLRRLRELVRPGGVLAVVGLARSGPADLPLDLAAAAASRLLRLRRGWHDPPSPQCWPPPETFAAMRRIVGEELPGAVFRRRLLWRYTVLWRSPEGAGGGG